MAKSCNQKGKILYLQKMLSETTSQKPVTMQEILAKLEEQGIRAERKSIYDDMETLRDFGMDIHYRRGREGGYYEEKSASDKTEADNTIIHQPDGETGEKSENVQTDFRYQFTLDFSKLQPGNYYYRMTAYNTWGQAVESRKYNFTVLRSLRIS